MKLFNNTILFDRNSHYGRINNKLTFELRTIIRIECHGQSARTSEQGYNNRISDKPWRAVHLYGTRLITIGLFTRFTYYSQQYKNALCSNERLNKFYIGVFFNF